VLRFELDVLSDQQDRNLLLTATVPKFPNKNEAFDTAVMNSELDFVHVNTGKIFDCEFFVLLHDLGAIPQKVEIREAENFSNVRI